jgi:UDP-glucose 4-epimerase
VLVTQREASIDRIREVLQWEPTVSLQEGLASVVDYLKMSGELS